MARLVYKYKYDNAQASPVQIGKEEEEELLFLDESASR